MTWTKFASDELVTGGYSGHAPDIVPLGVDHTLFYPRDRAESRRAVLSRYKDLTDLTFVVGVVGRNQMRKRIDLALSYFADWIHSTKPDIDALLYLHVAPTGESACDIRSLVNHYGLKGRVIVAIPHIGIGIEEHLMPVVYSSFDCYLSTCQGEGWGLPALEAMACGVPCIPPRLVGIRLLGARSPAYLTPCTSTALNAPLGGTVPTPSEASRTAAQPSGGSTCSTRTPTCACAIVSRA